MTQPNDTSVTEQQASKTAPIAGLCTPYCDRPCCPECQRRSSLCNDVLTLRDAEQLSVTCSKPADHTDAHGDTAWGVTWTDEHHA